MRRCLFVIASLSLACGAVGPEPAGAPSAPATSVAIAPAESAPAPIPSEAPKARPLNVLLILIDSLRADMPWNGYPRPIAPNLTQFAKESVNYTRAYSVSSQTSKSVGALLAGKYPSTMKRNGYFFTRFSADTLFFPELLSAAGVHTLSAHAHRIMKQDNNLNQGFDRWEVVAGIGPDTRTDTHVSSPALTALALEQLDGWQKDRAGSPFFLYVHYLDPHQDYLKHPESPDFGNKPRDRYDNEVFFTDLWLGRLLDHCRKQEWFEDTVVIVSADHGHAFGEHGMWRHAFELWDVLTQVPLLIRAPGAKPRRIEVPRSHIDLAPTILELMGVDAANDFVGKSLVPELLGAPAEPRPVVLDLPADSNSAPRRALVKGDYKLLVFEDRGRSSLFNVRTDPSEKRELSSSQPQILADMKAEDERVWSTLQRVAPHGGNRLVGGGVANGPK